MRLAVAQTAIILLLTITSSPNAYLLDAIEQFKDLLTNPEGRPFEQPVDKLFSEYDFIVIGAGTSGSTVASRLSEVPKWKILLLEAGGDEIAVTDIPLIAAHLQLTDFNWGYRAQHQPGACLGLDDQRCAWPRGKGMGGTSIINYMIYTRGHPRDYDGWEQMGNPGWGWKDVWKYFLKSENAHNDLENSTFHSTGGFLDVGRVPFTTPLVDAFVASGEERGFPSIDYNAGRLIGFSRLQVTQRNGARCSASKAFLRPVRTRPNLHIVKEAFATRIVISPKSKQTRGVEFFKAGKWYYVRTKREVILSAGAIDSPKLLLLSGIGPRAQLRVHDIPVIKEAPGVGNNLQEHVSMSGLTFLVNQTVGIIEDRVASLSNFLDYLYQGTGPITVPGAVEGLGYFRTAGAETPIDYPNMELIFAAGSLNSDDGNAVRRGIGVTDEIYDTVFKPINRRDAWTVWPMILNPRSRGWVRLKSKNPFVRPIMSGNYFDDLYDLETIVEGIKFAIKLSKTRAFQKFNSTLHDIPLPGCTHLVFNSDEYWRCAVRHLTTTLHHQCGTAKMGPESDPEAVVDHELRVHGVEGLRVVDASIIPRIPAAHTNAVCFMIAEKAADMIKSLYGK